MKKSKYTEQQIMFALKQVESGVRVPEVCCNKTLAAVNNNGDLLKMETIR